MREACWAYKTSTKILTVGVEGEGAGQGMAVMDRVGVAFSGSEDCPVQNALGSAEVLAATIRCHGLVCSTRQGIDGLLAGVMGIFGFRLQEVIVYSSGLFDVLNDAVDEFMDCWLISRDDKQSKDVHGYVSECSCENAVLAALELIQRLGFSGCEGGFLYMWEFIHYDGIWFQSMVPHGVLNGIEARYIVYFVEFHGFRGYRLVLAGVLGYVGVVHCEYSVG